MLPEPMIHDFVMPFPEDSQRREASDVVLPTQVYLLGAVNLHVKQT